MDSCFIPEQMTNETVHAIGEILLHFTLLHETVHMFYKIFLFNT
jgi:hypothetical protein